MFTKAYVSFTITQYIYVYTFKNVLLLKSIHTPLDVVIPTTRLVHGN